MTNPTAGIGKARIAEAIRGPGIGQSWASGWRLVKGRYRRVSGVVPGWTVGPP